MTHSTIDRYNPPPRGEIARNTLSGSEASYYLWVHRQWYPAKQYKSQISEIVILLGLVVLKNKPAVSPSSPIKWSTNVKTPVLSLKVTEGIYKTRTPIIVRSKMKCNKCKF